MLRPSGEKTGARKPLIASVSGLACVSSRPIRCSRSPRTTTMLRLSGAQTASLPSLQNCGSPPPPAFNDSRWIPWPLADTSCERDPIAVWRDGRVTGPSTAAFVDVFQREWQGFVGLRRWLPCSRRLFRRRRRACRRGHHQPKERASNRGLSKLTRSHAPPPTRTTNNSVHRPQLPRCLTKKASSR